MSAGKRGRFVRLLLVLAVVFGGASVAAATHDASSASTSAIEATNLSWDWG